MTEQQIIISASLVKELRDRSGVGMTKCKQALEEAKGNLEEAISILRKAGMASGVKKQGREAKEGAIFCKETDSVIAFVEINAETDFVAKNERFQEFAQNIAAEIAQAEPQSLESFLEQKYSKDPSISIDQYRNLIIQTIGENILISRIAIWKKNPAHSVGIYLHMGGKILACVEVSASDMQPIAKEIAMHTAACAPEYCTPEDVPQEIIDKEREIARGQVQGKPANIIEKIVDGKINAFFEGCSLVKQKYVKDTSKIVEAFLAESAKALNKEAKVVRFLRWMIGQS